MFQIIGAVAEFERALIREPGDLHYEIRLAAVSATAKKADAAKALIGFLAGLKAMQTFKAKGLEPL
jgi:hypothetical protein